MSISPEPNLSGDFLLAIAAEMWHNFKRQKPEMINQ